MFVFRFVLQNFRDSCFVLFDVFVECFRFTQEDKVEVYQIETKFLGWKFKKKSMTFFEKERKQKSQIDCNTLSVN